jgi:hypothetical protein
VLNHDVLVWPIAETARRQAYGVALSGQDGNLSADDGKPKTKRKANRADALKG